MRRLLFPLFLFALLSSVIAHAEVITVEHYSSSLQKETSFKVVLPQQYDTNKSYPVLYTLHGAYGSYEDWIANTDIEEYARDYEMLIVTPDGGQFGWYVDSIKEATSAYESYITEDLIAIVDKVFSTIDNRDGRGICGLSMGGHGALSLAAKHPELYSSSSSMSGILNLTNHPDSWHIIDRLGPMDVSREHWEANSVCHLAENFKDADVKLLIDCGEEDTKTGAIFDTRQCDEIMTNLGIDHIYNENPGTHSWTYWDEHIREHLAFHAGNFTKRARFDRKN